MLTAAGIEIRSPSEDELERFAQAVIAAFLETPNDEDIKRWKEELDPSRQYWALDGDVPVGTAGTYDHRLRIPGGEVPIAAVTLVGVQPSHRRRGILTQMMRRQLDHAHERGEPVAALWATEGSIYGRFGYGLATTAVSIEADRDRMQFRAPDEPAGRVRLVDDDEARTLVPTIYARVQAHTPGMLARHDSWWNGYRLADPEHWRQGGGPLFRAVWEDRDGEPQAYALYRSNGKWEGFIPAGTLQVREAIGTTPQATREIWRFLFGVDLINTVKTWHLPPDHPLFLLGDRAAAAARVLGRRALGAAASTCPRRSAEPVVRGRRRGRRSTVRDTFCSWNDGTWTLRAEGGRGAVERGGRRRPAARGGRPGLGVPRRLELRRAAARRARRGAQPGRRRARGRAVSHRGAAVVPRSLLRHGASRGGWFSPGARDIRRGAWHRLVTRELHSGRFRSGASNGGARHHDNRQRCESRRRSGRKSAAHLSQGAQPRRELR